MSKKNTQAQPKVTAKAQNPQDELLETMKTVKEFAEDTTNEGMSYDEFEAFVYDDAEEEPCDDCVSTLELFQELDESFDIRDKICVEDTRRTAEEHLDEFLRCKDVDAETLTYMLAPRVVFRNLDNFKEFKGYSIDINWLAKRLDKKFIRAHFTELLNRGVDPMLMVRKIFCYTGSGYTEFTGDSDDRKLLRKNLTRIINKENADELVGLAYVSLDDDLILELSKHGVSAKKLYDLAEIEWPNVSETKATLMVLKKCGLSSEDILDAILASEYRSSYAHAVMKDPDQWEQDLGVNRKDFIETYLESENDLHSASIGDILKTLSSIGCIDEILTTMPKDDFMGRVLDHYWYDTENFFEEYKNLGGNFDLLEERLLSDFDYNNLDQVEFALGFIREGRGANVDKATLLESIKTKWTDYFEEADELQKIVELLEG